MGPKIDMTNKIIHKLEPPRNTKHLPAYVTNLFKYTSEGGGVHLIITHKVTPGAGGGEGPSHVEGLCYSDKILLDDYATKVGKFVPVFKRTMLPISSVLLNYVPQALHSPPLQSAHFLFPTTSHHMNITWSLKMQKVLLLVLCWLAATRVGMVLQLW
jgi:hypothetical protein